MKPILIIVGSLIIVAIGYYIFMQPTLPGETPTDASQAKINVDAVCQGALAYMTFTDGASADAFVQECKEGKHPEVIEKYKADMNLDAGVAI